jgi:hypothetical protein
MSERDARGPEEHDAPLEWRAPSRDHHVMRTPAVRAWVESIPEKSPS